MSSAIGSAALILTANAQKLYQGLQEAGGRMTSWASGITSKLGGLLKTGMLAAGAAGAAALTKAAMDVGDLADQGRMAEALGITSESFTGLSHVFQQHKLDAEAVSDVLSDLADKIDDAAANGGDAAETLQALGINAKDLVGLPVDKQFEAVADAISKMDDAGRASGLTVRLLSDNGLKLLPVLRQGSEGIKRMTDEARRMGLVLGDQDMAKVREADAAMQKAGAALSGMWRQVLVALAPVIEAIAGGVGKALEGLSPIINKLKELFNKWWQYVVAVWNKIWAAANEVWERIGGKAGGVMEWIEGALDKLIRGFETAWGILLAVWDEVLSVVVEGLVEVIGYVQQVIDWVGQWIEETFGIAATFGTVEQFVTNCFKLIGKAGAYAWDTIKAGVGAVAIAIGFIVEKVFTKLVDAFYEVANLAKRLPDSIRPSWVNNFVDGVGRARDAVRGAGVGLQDWGKKQIDGWGNSAKAVDAWFDKLGRKRVEDIKAAAAEQRRAAAEAEAQITPAKYTAVGAMLKGSKEAWSMEARFKTENMLNPQLDLQRKQLQAQREANMELAEIRKGIGALGGGLALAIF